MRVADQHPTAGGRFLSSETLAQIAVLEKESPEFEFNEGYGHGYQQQQ